MRLLGICLGLLLTAGAVHGHFIWILPASKGDSARIVWSDNLKPDNKDEPLSMIEKAEVLLRDSEGRVQTLKWMQDKDTYHVDCPGKGSRTLAVLFDDDKNSRGKILMSYVCTTYLADPTGKAAAVGQAKSWVRLGVEMLPRLDRGADTYQVLHKGQPVADVRVVVEMPDDQVATRQSDKEGLFTFKAPRPGLYGFWVRHITKENIERNGKQFTSRRYLSCLVVEVPSPAPARND